MTYLPAARTTDLVVQSIGKEFLIYDLNTHKAFSLNETSAVVYNCCDGNTTFDELKEKHRLTDEIIFLALDELKKQNLIADAYDSPFAGMNRREVIRKVGLASVIALPVVTFLVAPTSLMSQSTLRANNIACASGSQCVSGNCLSSTCCAPSVGVNRAPGTPLSAAGFSGSCPTLTKSDLDAQCAVYNSACCSGSASSNGTCTTLAGNLVSTPCFCS